VRRWKLRSTIDNEFEYLEHNLSDMGFKNVVKRQMKTKRSKMKGRFMFGKKECHVFIEHDQWARLCEYWSKPETAKGTNDGESKDECEDVVI
jgi:hypothetical protein